MSNSHRANRLISETSPYLLQHAYNPVEWYPWGSEALERAKAENKLILVSIGYSACHWCHVMERECFEDAEVAQLMNTHFINIKLDREERPDIDAIYMDAVQLMRGNGGWPLNCFLLPDGRPIYGGTYFPKVQWMSLLSQLAEFWRDKPEKALEYGAGLTEAIAQMETAAINADERKAHSPEDAARIYIPLSQLFDAEWGGTQREPKFPLPVFWHYILRYAHFSKDLAANAALELTLRRMAWGGIYDAVGGGFSRYSVDGRWHVPHFEKMLYDNAQLISLYSEAYRRKPDPLYASVIRETVEFVLRELTSPEGGFYSALDADSEGVEGKFYVWTQAELNQLLGEKASLFAVAYNTSEAGNWEHGLNVLMRTQSDADIAQAAQLSLEQVEAELAECKQILFAERSKRTRPGLDDKVLVAWNGLMMKALIDASRALDEPRYLEHAKRSASFLAQRHLRPDGGLWRTSKGDKAHINAYLDDYAFYIKALVALYQATFDATYLEQAKSLMLYALEHFQDTEKGYFFYTSDLDDPLIARKKELYDSVIPSSNAIMAHALLTMGHYFDRIAWLKMAHHMLDGMVEQVQKHGSMFASWATLHLRFAFPEFQFAINGPQALEFRAELDQAYLPNVLPVGAFSDSRLPLLRNKYVEGKTKIYVCKDRACEMPVDTVEAALKQIGHSMGQA